MQPSSIKKPGRYTFEIEKRTFHIEVVPLSAVGLEVKPGRLGAGNVASNK